MPKRDYVSTKARQKAIIDIMNKGITSPTEIVRLLDLEYGIKTTRQTVTRDIANGVQPITEEIIEEHKESMLDNLDSLLEVAYNKGIRGDTASMRVYGQLQETRVKILQKIVEIQQEMNRAERPHYHINIGDFPEVKQEEKQDE
jgi:hypothetical protein